MFDDADNKINEEESDQQSGIDLLPDRIKKEKKSWLRSKRGVNNSKKKHKNRPALHVPDKHKHSAKTTEARLVPPKKQKTGKSGPGRIFKKISSLFRRKKKEHTPPAILSINAVSPKSDHSQSPKPNFLLTAQAKLDDSETEKKSHQSSPLEEHKTKIDLTPKEEIEDKVQFHKIQKEDVIVKSKESETDLTQLGVNLLPVKKRRLTDKQMITSYILIVVIGLLTIISPYVYLTSKNSQYKNEDVLLQEQIGLVTQKNKQLQEEIRQFGTLSYKLKHLLPLLENHNYWSEFFPTLEKHTVKNVYFTSLDVGSDYRVSLNGSALNLRDAVEQLIVFQNNAQYLETQLDSLALIGETDEPGSPTIDLGFSFILSADIIHPVTD